MELDPPVRVLRFPGPLSAKEAEPVVVAVAIIGSHTQVCGSRSLLRARAERKPGERLHPRRHGLTVEACIMQRRGSLHCGPLRRQASGAKTRCWCSTPPWKVPGLHRARESNRQHGQASGGFRDVSNRPPGRRQSKATWNPDSCLSRPECDSCAYGAARLALHCRAQPGDGRSVKHAGENRTATRAWVFCLCGHGPFLGE